MSVKKLPQYRVDEVTGCWIWLWYITPDGYGRLTLRNGSYVTTIPAHKYFYEKKYGSVPQGKELDHVVCNNSKCCNPDHVEPRTHKENSLRGLRNMCAKNARKTHCKNGHEFTFENTYFRKAGGRKCIQCHFKLTGSKYIPNGKGIKNASDAHGAVVTGVS